MTKTPTLVLSTQNPNKVREFKELLPSEIAVKTASELGILEDIEETEDTLEGNALLKAKALYTLTGLPTIADDTGLEIDALSGRPGVRSARYAGETKNPQANTDKVLQELEGKTNRKAQFRTVIAFVYSPEKFWLFEGIVKGSIALAPSGKEGFGYDPIFIPEQEKRTFAEMSPAEKHSMSHRQRALKKCLAHITPLLSE